MSADEPLTDYLGDGVHAQFDGHHIWLAVERCDSPFGPPDDPASKVRIERVALEPVVFYSLCRFAERCWPVNVSVTPQDGAS